MGKIQGDNMLQDNTENKAHTLLEEAISALSIDDYDKGNVLYLAEHYSKAYRTNKQINTDLSALHYVIKKDGNAWLAHYNDFINLQETDEFAFGDTPQLALQNFIDSRL